MRDGYGVLTTTQADHVDVDTADVELQSAISFEQWIHVLPSQQILSRRGRFGNCEVYLREVSVSSLSFPKIPKANERKRV